MRKKISPDTGKSRRYLILIFLVIVGLQTLLSGSYFGFIYIVIGSLLFKYMRSGGYVCFDEDYMFIVSKKQEKKIALKKITKIIKPVIQGNTYNNWDVYYENNQGEILKEKISPLFYTSNFKEFKKLIKIHNPAVKS